MKIRCYADRFCFFAGIGLLACAHPADDFSGDGGEPAPTRGGTRSTSGGGGKAGTLSGGGAHPANIAGTTTAGGGMSLGGNAGSAGTLGIGGAAKAGAAGANTSAGSGGSANVPAELEVDLKSGNSAPNDNQIRFAVRVVSSAKSSVPISSLELRYYFTNEVAPPLVIEIYDAVLDGSTGYHAVAHDAVKGEVTGSAADSYLKLTFSDAAGVLASGDSFTVDLALHGQNWTGNFAEADDYSFTPDHSDFSAWDHVTLFDAHQLIWGNEPP